MKPARLLLVPLVATALLGLEAPAASSACPGNAPKLFVVSTSGNLFSTPPSGGAFELEASAQVPLHSMVQLDGALWLGGPDGSVWRFDLATEQLTLALTVASDATSLVAHAGDLLIGGSDGLVVRVDPATGAAATILASDQPIDALAVDGDTLWAGSPAGEFKRADLAAGSAFVVAGLAGGPIHSMGQTATELYLGESGGHVWVFDKLSELAVYAYPVDGDATAIVRDGENFLIGGSNGLIHRVVQVIGTVVETYVAPEAVAAMWLEQPLGILQSSQTAIVAASGGTVQFELTVPVDQAGSLYVLLGTMSGTTPGIGSGDVHLALNPDAYFNLLLAGAGSVAPQLGTFDAAGHASAQLTVPPGTAASLAGAKFHHAFLVFDPTATPFLVGASDAAPLTMF